MESPPGTGEKRPDVWDLFRHYDMLYFRGALVDAAFTVDWTAPRVKTTSCFGSCSFGRSKTITLYEPLLRNRPADDLKNALLHLMIHAIIFLKHGLTCLTSHGPNFRDWMDAINSCSIEDYLRPKRGYCITTTHDFSREKILSIQGNLWKCESCGVELVRATKLGAPSNSCCIENYSQDDETCGNELCYWHNHKTNCGGTYVVPGRQGQKMVPKVKRELLTETSETSKSQAGQESDSDEVQGNSTVAKPNAEGRLLSQVYHRTARSPGSSSSKKASKSNMAEDFQKAIVLATPPRSKLKPKQEFVASEKHEHFSMVSCNNAKSLGSCSSKKAHDFQKAIVASASSPSNLKRKQTSVASEKHEFISLESCNNAKSSRSNTSSKADKWHHSEHVQKSGVQPFASHKKPKLEKDMVFSEKYGAFSLGSCNNAKPPRSSTSRNAGTWHKPEGVEKSSGLATPLKKLKVHSGLVASEKAPLVKLEPGLVALEKHGDAKPPKSSTSRNAGGWHKPEGVEKSSGLATPLKKLKLDSGLVASKKAPLLKLEPGLVALEKHGDAKQLGSSTGNKLGKVHKPEYIQKASVLPAAPPRNLNLKQGLVASQKAPLLKLEPGLVALEKHGDAKQLGSSTGNKVGKVHKPESIEKASVLPATPSRNLNLKQGSIVSHKNELSSSVGRSKSNADNIKANRRREHEETRKPIACPAASQSILRQQNKTNSSVKAGKQHTLQEFQKTFVQPAVSQRKLKQSNPVAPKKPMTRSKTSAPPRKKGYACVSVWANIYESECSSGPDEPLVNKRTERRKRERERSVQLTYSRSKKRSASGISSTKAQPAEEEIGSQYTQPPSQPLEVILIDAADEVVTQDPRDQLKAPVVTPVDLAMTQAPRGQSQPPTQRMNIAVLPADLVIARTSRGLQPPAQSMDIVIPPANLLTTRIRGDLTVPSTSMDIVAVPPADQVMTLALVDQSQPPAACSVAPAQAVPPHPADPPSSTPSNPSTYPDVIDISDCDDD